MGIVPEALPSPFTVSTVIRTASSLEKWKTPVDMQQNATVRSPIDLAS